jgi:hypothetical protein
MAKFSNIQVARAREWLSPRWASAVYIWGLTLVSFFLRISMKLGEKYAILSAVVVHIIRDTPPLTSFEESFLSSSLDQ